MVNVKASIALIGAVGYLTIATICAALFGGYGLYHGTKDRLSIACGAAGSLSLSLHLLLLAMQALDYCEGPRCADAADWLLVPGQSLTFACALSVAALWLNLSTTTLERSSQRCGSRSSRLLVLCVVTDAATCVALVGSGYAAKLPWVALPAALVTVCAFALGGAWFSTLLYRHAASAKFLETRFGTVSVERAMAAASTSLPRAVLDTASLVGLSAFAHAIGAVDVLVATSSFLDSPLGVWVGAGLMHGGVLLLLAVLLRYLHRRGQKGRKQREAFRRAAQNRPAQISWHSSNSRGKNSSGDPSCSGGARDSPGGTPPNAKRSPASSRDPSDRAGGEPSFSGRPVLQTVVESPRCPSRDVHVEPSEPVRLWRVAAAGAYLQ